MTDFISVGILLGLSAGFAPGPLLTLVISETLRHGMASGIRVAVSPLFTDLPIIFLTLLVLSTLSEFGVVLGLISLVGACVVFYMGYESLRVEGFELELSEAQPRSLMKGILVNALSPHPYLFWLTVGGPILNKALGHGAAGILAFVGSFYVLLIGSKVLLAVLVGKSRSFLVGRVYLYTMRVLGLALCVLAIVLLVDGLRLVGVGAA